MSDITEIKTIARFSEDSDPIVRMLINEDVIFVFEEGKDVIVEYDQAKYTEAEINKLSDIFFKRLENLS